MPFNISLSANSALQATNTHKKIVRIFNATIKISLIAIIMTICNFNLSAQTITILDDISGRKAAIEEVSSQLTLYPNPAKEKVILKVEGEGNIKNVRILDLTGRTIQQIRPSILTQSFALHLHRLPSSTYIAQIETEHETLKKKFTVIK